MKIKSLIFTALVFGALATTSCSKEKDCECTASLNGTVLVTTTVHITEGECDAENETTTDAAGNVTVSECKEK